ncbi:acyltransferase domain-containing protein [Streptomyces sp. LUP30]|uniref:acyltransferase domain-containing protein n=1 Tax=Streptomyces sp. LUP30 TaxID=1890285 RepID=UPI00099FBBDA|nr:acyltransferase domain-containing protein [Streptomyces sp. LUP30]
MTAEGSAILFPGQGGFDGAALNAAGTKYQQVGETFEAVDAVAVETFGKSVSAVLFEGAPLTADDLVQQPGWVSQLAVYASDVAAWRILQENGLRPRILVGHSMGEIPALVAAGVFCVEDGARIVAERLRVLEEADLPAGRMAALTLDGQRTRRLLGLLDDPAVVVAAENHDRQTVISGPEPAVGAALRVARELNAGGVLLASPYAFHNPALEPVRAPFAARIGGLPRHAPRTDVYSPILRRVYRADDDLPALLAEHLVRPVDFRATVRALHEDGVTTFVEAGGLGSLGRCVERALPDADDLTIRSTFTVDADGRLGVERTLATLSGDAEPDPFERFWADYGARLVARVQAALTASAATLAHPAPPMAAHDPGSAASMEPAAPPPVPAGAPDRAELLASVRTLYAQALEYPEEVFTEEVLLEAELGIDSVKQVELLTRVTGRYGLPPSDVRLSDHDTVGKVVDLLHARLTGGDVSVAAA